MTDIPGKPDCHKYQCYTAGIPLAEAVRLFVQKFGREPERHYTFVGLHWLGPVPEE